MLYFILASLIYAFIAPFVHRAAGKYGIAVQAGVPLVLFVYFATFLPDVQKGEVYTEIYNWVPSLGVQLYFYLDGLALLFTLLISGFGTLVMYYASQYLKDDAGLGRLYMYLTLFMVAMLGLVTAGNLVTVFICWELTSITSYLLIGHTHEKETARQSALQALLVTGLGGMALMAGFVLLGIAGDSYTIPELLTRNDLITHSSLYLPMLILILLGAFTKSAQFPFHFWLPNAMAAPTPVSAYLHSATMVKAGIYLLARLSPALSGPDVWHFTLLVIGTTTALLGAFLALQNSDLKAILAYTTVSALGLLVSLIGLGTDAAIQSMVVFLLAHALYKGGLFMVAGNIDHAAGTREYPLLNGLHKQMRFTGIAAMLAALSMAGVLPFIGFIAKELLYEAKAASSYIILALSFMVSVAYVAVATIMGYRIFWHNRSEPTKLKHQGQVTMAYPPLILGICALVFGLMPGHFVAPILGQAASATLGETIDFELSLWHGFTPVLWLSVLTILAGIFLYSVLQKKREPIAILQKLYANGPNKLYFVLLNGLQRGALHLTATIQNGYLRLYIASIILTQVALLLYTIWYNSPTLQLQQKINLLQDVLFHEWLLILLVLPAIYMLLKTTSRLTAIATLSIIGYTASLLYYLFGAPDIAATQLLIETLTVVIFVLVLHKLPRFQYLTHAHRRIKFVVISVLFGATMTYVLLLVKQFPLISNLKEYYGQNAYLLGKGKNIVNVILIDFRAFDTLGEMTVLAVAAIGIFALLRLRMDKEEKA
ncbi:hydrogen gas-evolving membrane-bound hydrogenase subunit E [Pontibacter burrus]|uniref:DUF4040 domain-containing protein n=1 Tax=Pontibacter burrus TaxID=2704466 RepID=A0A6B3LZ41_9BACT|nr:hydrogen gas-evolving membrane-bound hydrogenase subunit E [Pontibacter burrus]NEM98744.1 DUF4040 domain-containing protein [Pontibacter burrus]